MTKFGNYSEPYYHIGDGEGEIIGKSPEMIRLFHIINQVCGYGVTVLIRGETGSGKGLIAKAIHYNRKEGIVGRFVAVNCAGIPEGLLESELFGHKKGAFTGAHHDREGKFQYANKGTLFLDEIGDMSLPLQAKILRAIEDRIITPIGGNEPVGVNVRIIASTNANLEDLIKENRFRRDLFYRLNVFPLYVPPLRERLDDIESLCEYLVKLRGGEYGITGISRSALERLRGHLWPGNVRELENVLVRAFIMGRKKVVEARDIRFDGEESQKTSMPIDLTETGTKRYWFSEGVLPIIIPDLSKMEGARSPGYIQTIAARMASDGQLYIERIGNQTRRTPILYLTPANVDFFFRNRTTKEYKELLTRIKEGPFNKIAERPFKIFSTGTLFNNPNTYRDIRIIRRVIKETGAYLLSGTGKGKYIYFAVREEDVPHFVPSRVGDREERIQRLRAEVMGAYDSFRSWVPR